MGIYYEPMEEAIESTVKVALERQRYLKEHGSRKQMYSEEVLRKLVRDALDKKRKLD